ncbi:MAG: carboxypeptidase regulatory-like domain-containing protein [Pirellulaceae bacterium]
MLQRIILAASLVSLAVGCGGNANLGAVRGKVTLDGQPLERAFVVFAPTSGGTTSYGRTDGQGNYEMMFSDTEAGAWLGENVVRISTADVGTGDTPGSKERVPLVYNRDSTLKVTVASTANEFNFDLKTSAGAVQTTIIE